MSIEAFSHLQHMPQPQEALKLLKKVAGLVKPIMQARGWRVRLLSEFYPEPRTLGMNTGRGVEIELRLRMSENPGTFLYLEGIVDTMLHELAHMVHGPHGPEHDALWDDLRRDLNGLTARGFTGEGYLGSHSQRRLSGRAVPYEEVRRLTRDEAARRRGTASMSFSQRLDLRGSAWEGGSELGCANGRGAPEMMALSRTSARNGFRTRAEEDSPNESAVGRALWELVQEDRRGRYPYGGAFGQSSAFGPSSPFASRMGRSLFDDDDFWS
ncbi:WLM-domain-containing protein [Trichocladium antarcticum]|uniref:WLM-domain-containing protein n=1 Tax=Trichocladium antarcticum TaxID=1450529 RepID=A0AAN6ZC06_9PEZI|nr:WLM-domain-containing protein [Trichocladium antarcticum]